jgi:hypothetical protein
VEVEEEAEKNHIKAICLIHISNSTQCISACSFAYNLSLNPQHEAINSQCNEQANASLKRIKDQLSYMTADNFMTQRGSRKKSY